MNTFWNWLVYSSTNSEKISLTVKGFIGVVVAVITNIILLGHFNLNPDAVANTGESVITFVQAVITVASAVVALIGAARKIKTTKEGTNEVLNNSSL